LSGNAAISSAVPQNVPQDRRAHPRYAVDGDSVLLVVNRGISLQCRILELSLKGCRLRMLQPSTLAPQLRVEVAFKVHGAAFRFLGAIQWAGNEHLIGIRFSHTVARHAEQLAEVISELEAAAREKAAKNTACTPSAKTEAVKQAHEQIQADQRHRAQIQQVTSIARTERKAVAQIPVLQPPSMRERRVHTRHDVDTTATIVLIKTGSRLDGRIVDLSVSGCRIRADQRFPVGVYTRVETEFQFGGLPFLLGGVIQNMHDPQTVGIRFLDLSDRKREQLQQLIAEISEEEPKKLGS
jgi:hypothetical protein